MFLYITAIPPPLLPLSALCISKPYPVIARMVSQEDSVSQVSVMKAISIVSRACITTSVLLQIERTFHNTQEIETSVVGIQACFLVLGNMVCFHVVSFVQRRRLGIWVRLPYDRWMAFFPSDNLCN